MRAFLLRYTHPLALWWSAGPSVDPQWARNGPASRSAASTTDKMESSSVKSTTCTTTHTGGLQVGSRTKSPLLSSSMLQLTSQHCVGSIRSPGALRTSPSNTTVPSSRSCTRRTPRLACVRERLKFHSRTMLRPTASPSSTRDTWRGKQQSGDTGQGREHLFCAVQCVGGGAVGASDQQDTICSRLPTTSVRPCDHGMARVPTRMR